MTDRPVKQVILMRIDTVPPMRKGKMIAQGAHAAMMWLKDLILSGKSHISIMSELTAAQQLWLKGDYAKICVGCTMSDIMKVCHECDVKNIRYSVVTDLGKTEFNGQETITCMAVGPDYACNLDPITSYLKLL